jgi:TM2 domain-containing membrane protein YozV/predicted Fe-S protein YdhL (DUF1289 family)
MDCVNHPGISATAYCQNCGKALCAGCVRNAAGGQILCEPCWTAWQSYQQPFVVSPAGGPNPAAAAVLGVIPGVGAMYNGQFFKGLIHVVIFAVLISITTHYGIFGIFIAAWIVYQSFEAFHTARAMRDGQPLPDPLGLNEVGNWLNMGNRPRRTRGRIPAIMLRRKRALPANRHKARRRRATSRRTRDNISRLTKRLTRASTRPRSLRQPPDLSIRSFHRFRPFRRCIGAARSLSARWC